MVPGIRTAVVVGDAVRASKLLAASPEGSHASIGPAQIDFVVAHDADELQRLTTAPEPAKKAEPELHITIDGKLFTVPIAGNIDKHVDLGDSAIFSNSASPGGPRRADDWKADIVRVGLNYKFGGDPWGKAPVGAKY